MKNTLKLLKRPQLSAGFTLAEVILASVLTLMVVSTAAFGVVAMIKDNRIANAKSEVQNNLNRAVEFVSDEMRGATRIYSNPADAVTAATDFPATGKTPILAIDVQGVSQPIIYYTTNPTAPWLGPRVIGRWGPNFNASGQYSNPTDPPNWTSEPLVDMIATTSNNIACNNTGWTRTPTNNSNVEGFFACVRADERMAEIHVRASASLSIGEDPISYDVATQVFARSQ
jgi:hypothetical protein